MSPPPLVCKISSPPIVSGGGESDLIQASALFPPPPSHPPHSLVASTQNKANFPFHPSCLLEFGAASNQTLLSVSSSLASMTLKHSPRCLLPSCFYSWFPILNHGNKHFPLPLETFSKKLECSLILRLFISKILLQCNTLEFLLYCSVFHKRIGINEGQRTSLPGDILKAI